ncbi:hypothetical protein PUN28_006236 [Cardiocondyla obscurior]|uniref:Uncharacterized protein n=1 Tax=Cardiocondyla obscurior TaxID=286306 RepID=A0AAW2GBE0_9HYME
MLGESTTRVYYALAENRVKRRRHAVSAWRSIKLHREHHKSYFVTLFRSRFVSVSLRCVVFGDVIRNAATTCFRVRANSARCKKLVQTRSPDDLISDDLNGQLRLIKLLRLI